MRLRLNTTLRAALIAAITAVGFTVTDARAYGRELTQVTTTAGEVTYNGYVFNMLLDNQNAFATRNFYQSTYNEASKTWSNIDPKYASSNTPIQTPFGQGAFWTMYCSTANVSNSLNYYGTTLRLSGSTPSTAEGNRKLTTNFSDFTIGGLIADDEWGSTQYNVPAYWFYRGGSMDINGYNDVNMDINSYVRFSYAGSVNMKKGGTWNIHSGKTLEFDNNASGNPTTFKFYEKQALTVQGGGTLNLGRTGNGTYNVEMQAGSSLHVTGDGTTVGIQANSGTFTANGAITVDAGSTLSIGMNTTLGRTITNAGTVTFGSGKTVTLSSDLSGFDYEAVFTDYEESTGKGFAGTKTYTVINNTGSGTSNLASVTHGGQSYTLTNGKFTLVGDTDYTTYYIQADNATVDLAQAISYAQTQGGGATLSTVNVQGANATITVGSAQSLNTLNILAGKDATVDGAGMLTLNGLTGAGALNIAAGTTVELTNDNMASLGNISVGGEGTLRLVTTTRGEAANALGTVAAPILALADNSSTTGRYYYGGSTNFSGVGHLQFAGGQLWLGADMTYGGKVTFGTTTYTESNDFSGAAMRVNASGTFNGAVDVQGTAKLVWGESNKTLAFNSTVTGSGNINLIGWNGKTGTFTIGGDASGFAGAMTTNDKIALNVAEGAKLTLAGGSSLAGAVTLNGALTANNAAETTATISGNISGNGTIAKEGAGTLTLSGSLSEFTGAMNVNAGTLVVTQGVNASKVTVGTGASLTLGGAVTFTDNTALTNNGTVTLTTSGLVFNLNGLTAAESEGVFTYTLFSGNDVNLSALTTDNITLTGGLTGKSWTFGTNGTISYTVSTATKVWTGDDGSGNWNYEEANWSDEQFKEGDIAQFNVYSDVKVNDDVVASAIKVTDSAVANIENDETTPGSLTAGSVEINGALVTSIGIEGVQSYSITEGSGWTIYGEQTLIAGTGTNNGNIWVWGEDASLTFTGTATAADLAGVTNDGTVSVDFGSATARVDMEDSSGILEVRGGTVDYRSKLGEQTLKLGAGTKLLFGDKDGAAVDAPVFTNDIVLGGNATIQVHGNSKHSSVTISGDVTGTGYTLTKADGNQNLTFSGVVNIGGLTTASDGNGTIIFNGGEGSLGTIVTNGAVTIQFSAKEGAGNVYSFDTFSMSPGNNNTRWLRVDQGVTVNGTGASLGDVNATIMNSWGLNGGGLEVNGTLNTAGTIGMDSGANTSYIKGTGIINTAGLDLCNQNTTYIQGGITVNITSNRGIFRRNTANASTIHLVDATLQAKEADWEFMSGGSNYTVTLDSSTGTTFDAATGRTITVSKGLGGTGKLVKAGEGTLVLNAANTYTGGTDINAGTVKASNDSALGSEGTVTIAADATLEVNAALNLGGRLQSSGSITVNAEKSLTLTSGSSIYETITNNGTVNLSGVTLGDGFTEQGGGTAYFDVNGAETDESSNHYVGSKAGYVQVVSGGTVTGSGEADIMWKDKGYVLGTDGRIVTGTGTPTYDTFYIVDADSSENISAIANHGTTAIDITQGTLVVDQETSGIAITVSEYGTITGDYADATQVGIASEASAQFAKDVETSGVKFTPNDITQSVYVYNGGDQDAAYSTDNRDMSVSAGALIMTDQAQDATVSNTVYVDEIVNTTGRTLTLDNVEDTLELVNMDITASTARVYTDLAQDTEATVSISGVLQGGEATLLANLKLVGGAGSMLDVDGGADKALTLGSTLTIDTTEGLVNLDQDTINALAGLQEGQWLDLIVAADGTQLGYVGAQTGMSYDQLFSAEGLTGPYTVYANEGSFGLVRGSQVPEPTTGTLSLLALAALAARRRRK